MKVVIFYCGRFGEKVIGNLTNSPGFCNSCNYCTNCRAEAQSEVNDIIAIEDIANSENTPDFLKGVRQKFSQTVLKADIALMINVKLKFILEILPYLKELEIKGIIACSEQPWGSQSELIKLVEDKASELGIESALATPFCAIKLDVSKPKIAEFLEKAKIGEPEISLMLQKGRNSPNKIMSATVKRSAPCGSTWYICRQMLGLDPDHPNFDKIISDAHLGYPCTASKDYDSEISDTAFNKAEFIIHQKIKNELKKLTEQAQHHENSIDEDLTKSRPNNECGILIISKKEDSLSSIEHIWQKLYMIKAIYIFILLNIFLLILFYIRDSPSTTELIGAISLPYIGYKITRWIMKDGRYLIQNFISKLKHNNGIENGYSSPSDLLYGIPNLIFLMILSILMVSLLNQSSDQKTIFTLHNIIWRTLFVIISLLLISYLLSNFKDIENVIVKGLRNKSTLGKIFLLSAIFSLIIMFIPSPLGILFNYELLDPNPDVVHCIPGYPEQIVIEKNEGLVWQVISSIFQDKLKLNNQKYRGVNVVQSNEKFNNTYILNITIDEDSNVPDGALLEIYLQSSLFNQKCSDKKIVKLNALPLSINFDSNEGVIATRNTKISKILRGNFPQLGMECLNLSANSNITGIQITFNPPQISSKYPYSNMTINIGDNVEYNPYKLIINGEYDTNKNVNCSLDLIVEKYKISGFVFNDDNADGYQDSNEQGLYNWKINLYKSKDNFTIETALTDEKGYYELKNLDSDTYIIQEMAQTGWHPTIPKSGVHNFTLNNHSGSNLNFGNRKKTISISGNVFEDVNSNEIREPSEPLLPDWEIQLNGPNNLMKYTRTNDNGFFEFEDLMEGNYSLTETLKDGWIYATPKSGSYSFFLDQIQNSYDFGNRKKTISISGNVFEDVNSNEIREPSEPLLPDWEIQLNGPNNLKKYTRTNDNGFFEFEDLMEGNYSLTETLKDGWIYATPKSGSYSFFLDQIQNSYDFGNRKKTISISGNVFEDVNSNEIREPSEPLLPDWEIQLNGPNNLMKYTRTNDNGFFEFEDLMEGNYSLTETLKDGWIYATPKSGSYSFFLDQIQNSYDFGNRKKTISISGNVFEDVNSNEIREPSEPLLPDWEIQLNGPNNLKKYTRTNDNGFFEFEDLMEGNYSLTETLKDGWIYATPKSGSYSFFLDQIQNSYDFGNRKKTISISGNIFEDINCNGIDDNGEPGLENWRVILTKPDASRNETSTNDNGIFVYNNLASGKYELDIINQDCFIETSKHDRSFILENDKNMIIGYHKLPSSIGLENNAINNKKKATSIMPYRGYSLYYKFWINNVAERNWTDNEETQASYIGTNNITVCVIDAALKNNQFAILSPCNCFSKKI